jgi:hypothetical protein
MQEKCRINPAFACAPGNWLFAALALQGHDLRMLRQRDRVFLTCGAATMDRGVAVV